MAVELIDPAGVIRTDVHHQASKTVGATIVSLAGQVSWDADGNLVGDGDLTAQTEQCLINVAASLAGAGATMNDLTRLTFFVVGLDPTKGEQVIEGKARASRRLGVELTQPGTYVGVTSLFSPGFLIEVEATAVLA